MFEVEEKVLQAVLQYLAQRPYLEVRDLIAALQQSKKAEDKEQEQGE